MNLTNELNELTDRRPLNPWASIAAILFMYICWGIAQWVAKTTEGSDLSAILFSLLYCTISGVLIPLFIKRKKKLAFNFGKPNYLWSSISIVITLVVGLILSGAVKETLAINYGITTIVKYLLLFFPMALALSLFAFFIIPHTLKNRQHTLSAKIVLVIAIALFFFIGFWVDQLFQVELAITMGLLGLLFGICFLFVRNFWTMFSVFYITILFNTLAESKYVNYPMWVVILCSVLCVALLVAFARVDL